MTIFAATFSSCKKQKIDNKILKHWGVETYVRWETDSLGVINYWDTLYYTVGEGKGYEVTFRSNGEGSILNNDSPALIKSIPFKFNFDENSMSLNLKGNYFFGVFFPYENTFPFEVECLSDTALIAWWQNRISEPKPFFERFFLKPIE